MALFALQIPTLVLSIVINTLMWTLQFLSGFSADMKAIWTGSNRLKLLQASRSRSYWDSVWYNHSEEVKVTLKFAYGHIKSYTSVVMPQSHYSCNYGYLRLYRSCDLQCTVLNLVKFGPVTSTLRQDLLYNLFVIPCIKQLQVDLHLL